MEADRRAEVSGPAAYWARRTAGTADSAAGAPMAVPSGQDEGAHAARLMAALLSTHAGRDLADVYPVSWTRTAEGSCATVRLTRTALRPAAVDPHAARARIQQALRLVYGIGPHHAARFHRAGVSGLADLLPHPVFGPRARSVLAALTGSPADAFACVRDRTSPSHPLLWWTSALCPRDTLLFVDIETLGFFGVPIILVGLAEWTEEGLLLTQYVARAAEDEPALLAALASHLQRKPVLVTFNGKSFDWPMLQSRAAYWGLPLQHPGWPHYDLLHFARRAWKDRLADFQATTIERDVLGIQRAHDLPGSHVPEFYERYRQDGNIGPLTYIIDHNQQDLIGLVHIFDRLTADWDTVDAG